MTELMKSMKEEMRTSTKAYQAGQEQMASLVTRIEANQAKMDVNLNEIREEIKSGQAEMRSIVTAWMADTKNGRKETMACQGKMEVCLECEEPTSVTMKSEAEHWGGVPKKEAAVMPVGGLRKGCRDRNLAAKCRQKPKEGNQRSCESWKRLTIASRRMICCAGVAWLRRNAVRKDRTRKQVEHRTPNGRAIEKKCQPKPESMKKIRIRGFK
jgi:hypothetical protein